MRMRLHLGLSTFILLCAVEALGQQTGSITGRVTLAGGDALPGVAVAAASDVLPLARTATTSATGEYRLPLLPPGEYELTFTLGDMATETRRVSVQLEQNAAVDVTMGPEAVREEIDVLAEAPVIDRTSAEIKTAITGDVIEALPVGQDYRDLQKLIPGVQYTEDDIRGPSAGGNGQDNVYKFDGVNVTLPLFGVLSSEPSSHDIDQVAIVKGGAKALDFNRSGGFTIDSVSKSGTNEYHGAASYQVQSKDTTSERELGQQFEEDKQWALLSLGGPVLRERLFFYGSYFRPTIQRDNSSNAYGPVPNFESTRDEFFGKLSYQPTSSVLLNGSYRDSDRENQNKTFEQFATASTSLGEAATLEITTFEGSWIISQQSFLSFKYTDFENQTASLPDTRFGFPIRLDGSVDLDVANLDRQGQFLVPTPIAGQTAYNDFIAPLIQRYGFLQNGVRTGGGKAGGGLNVTDNDFFRESYEAGYDWYLGSNVTHELHFGYQRYKDEEDLSRISNGWGQISVIGGRSSFNGTPVFYEARLFQMGVEGSGGAIAPIHSEFESQSFEVNDNIRLGNWSFNVGLLASNDQLFGQDLRENSANLSGFEIALGSKYKMYELDFEDMIQPRLGAVWSYNGRDTLYANWARYYPAASSLPRAASWARNNVGREIFARFDAAGNLIGTEQVGSSSGKFFQPDLDPRGIDEYLLGTSRQINSAWTARVSARYRYGYNFWEDTNNNARIAFLPPEGVERALYIPELPLYQSEIGGSSYVIAELDGAFTKYYEVSLETERRGRRTFVRGSYVWSHYYGNFDQDNTTTDNDQSIFIGSSFIGDGAGRQLWNLRDGDLRGDRRHQLKVYGYYELPWNARAAAFGVYQSGQPWEVWDVEVYRALTTSTSDVSRYAEPAGSRRTDAHYQIDLNYTQDFPLLERYNLQLRADVFNVTNNQTGYNVQAQRHSAGFAAPRTSYDPRRLQLAVRFEL